MAALLLLLNVLAALALLWVGAEGLVRGASSIAARLGISPLAIGLTVVAFGTSAPELAVSMGAALGGTSDIAIGNVVGSNICNIALILGLAALIRPVAVQAKIVRMDAPLLVVVTLLLLAIVSTGGISRMAGVFLFGGLLFYTAFTFVQARRESQVVKEAFSEHVVVQKYGLSASICLVLAGLAALAGGGELLVRSAVTIAETIGVSKAVIGLTIVALGTSLPELATSVVAAGRSQGDIAIGNIIGSNLFNILGILGVTAVVTPMPLGGIVWFDLIVMSLLAVVLLPIARTGFIVSRTEGLILLAVYAGYIAWRLVG